MIVIDLILHLLILLQGRSGNSEPTFQTFVTSTLRATKKQMLNTLDATATMLLLR